MAKLSRNDFIKLNNSNVTPGGLNYSGMWNDSFANKIPTTEGRQKTNNHQSIDRRADRSKNRYGSL